MSNFTAEAEAFATLHDMTANFLYELIAIPSVSNDELAACDYCYEQFKEIPGIKISKQFMDDSIMDNPRWCCGPYPVSGYEGHYNIDVTWEGTGEQEPVYLNAHIDTVAPCDPALMPPRIDGDTIFGLGSHDDKGHVAVIYALFHYISKFNIRLPFDLVAHLVVEEEIGGNGSLFAVSRPLKGQAAIMLDGGGGVIANACRGAIWPRITCYGESCHPSARQSVKFYSAYDRLKKAISVIEAVHDEYCAEVAANPVKYFEGITPPLNIGSVHAGNWPSTVPTEAVACMVFGVFPGRTNAEMRKRIEDALAADPDLKGNYKIEFIYDVDSAVTDIDDPLVTQLQKAMIEAGLPGVIRTFNAACDIGFYRNILGIPAVDIGIGAQNAHSAYESVEISDVLKLAHALARWLLIRAGTHSGTGDNK
jgi:acetylornithine deacetylase